MALFTVEQIELIRRLRSSGITREQVLLAFTELERLDAEFGRSGSYGNQMQTHNMEFSFSSTAVVRNNCSTTIHTGPPVPIVSAPVPNINDSSLHISFNHNEYYRSQPVPNSNPCEDISSPSILNGDCSVNAPDLQAELENGLALPQVNGSSSLVPCSDSLPPQNVTPNSFNCSFYPMDVQSEELAELQELKKIEKSFACGFEKAMQSFNICSN